MELVARRDLLFNLTRAELTARYRSAALGLLWFILTPLVLMIVLTIVFEYVIHLGIPNYPIFVFSALLPFTFFQVSLLNSATSVSRAPGLVKRAQLPRVYLPLAAIGANLAHYLVALLLLFPLMLVLGVPLTPALLLLPLAIAFAIAIVIGAGLLTAALNVAHRDVELLLSAGTRVLFWLSPIFYPLSAVPVEWRPIYLLNPVVGMIEMHRSLLVFGTLPPFEVMAISGLSTLVLLVAGIAVFARRAPDFEDYL